MVVGSMFRWPALFEEEYPFQKEYRSVPVHVPKILTPPILVQKALTKTVSLFFPVANSKVGNVQTLANPSASKAPGMSRRRFPAGRH